MKPGAEGKVTFIPAKAGEYYYICAVPGHREQGMEGKILVKEGGGASSEGPSGATVAPTGKKVEFSLDDSLLNFFPDLNIDLVGKNTKKINGYNLLRNSKVELKQFLP